MLQDGPLLVSSPGGREALAQKDAATALVISDSHGFTAQLTFALLEKGQQCDALFFCGDGISDVCALLRRAREDSTFAKSVPPVVCMVEGNCDTEFYDMGTSDGGKGILQVPLMQTVGIAGHTVLCTHGHRFSLYNGTASLEEAAQRHGADIVLYGHTHIAHSLQQGQTLIANPGSCAKPRAGQPPSYALLTVSRQNPLAQFTVYQIAPGGSRPYCP